MPVFPQFFLAFMGSDFSQFTFSSAGHLNLLVLWVWRPKAVLKAAGDNYAIMLKKGQAVEKGLNRAVLEKSLPDNMLFDFFTQYIALKRFYDKITRAKRKSGGDVIECSHRC